VYRNVADALFESRGQCQCLKEEGGRKQVCRSMLVSMVGKRDHLKSE
jgi:hypothetical protein